MLAKNIRKAENIKMPPDYSKKWENHVIVTKYQK